MNHAYADGSQAEGVGGWGVVLLVPGLPQAHHCGRAPVADNGACELLAVLEAVRLAPEGQPLTVHTDATCAVQAVRRGTLHPQQSELGARVRRLAHERGVRLSVVVCPRSARRAQEAHQLASGARLGMPASVSEQPQVRVRVRKLAWGAQASLTFKRDGQIERAAPLLSPLEGVPPALLALRELIRHARPGEHLSVRLDSALVPSWWQDPDPAAHPAARAVLEEARAGADAHEITLEFV